MKTTELMFGDWFVTNKWLEKPFRVCKFGDSSRGLWVWGTTSDGTVVGPFFLHELVPILITPEILQRNGFKCNPSTSRKAWQIANNDVYVSWWRNRLNIMYRPAIGRPMNHLNVDGKYVHELQHALTMSGIETVSIEL